MKLEEITGKESGAILFENGEIIVCNWRGIEGIPRHSPFGIIGLGENFVASPIEEVPEELQEAMREDEIIHNGESFNDEDRKAWEINTGSEKIIVATHDEWA